MNIKNIHIYVMITLFMMTLLHCTSEKLPFVDENEECLGVEVTYELNIKPILDNSCYLGGCHVTGGDGPGIYADYESIIPDIMDGTFESTVVERREDPNIGMPPDWSNNGAPKDLTDEELALVKCWILAGYPEK